MSATKPIFTEGERRHLHTLDESFKTIKDRKQAFLETIFPEDVRLLANHHPDAILKLAQDNDSIIFKGYGHTLQAQPEYFIHESEWRVKYLFHLLHTALDGKKHFTPLYQIELCSNGLIYIGGEDPNSINGTWQQESFIYNRIKQNLLCAVVQSLEANN